MSMFHELMMKKRGIPSRYQEVEWIQGDGVGAYIETGLTANQDTTIKIVASNNTSGTNSMLGTVDTGNTIYGLGQQYTNNYLFGSYYVADANTRIISTISGNDDVVRTLELRKNEFYIDNVLIGTKTAKTFTTENTLKIFTFSSTGSKAQSKVRNTQIYNNNTLVRNYIPVYDILTNKYGMWETVQGKFYGNAGTGDFKGSIVGYTIVGSPTITDGVVSGFSSSDYLKVISKSANSHEINITLTTPSSLSNNTECIYRQSTNFLYINGSTHKLGFQYTKNGGGNSWLNGQTVLLPNTTYYIKVIYVALDKIQIYMSTDGTNYNLEVQSSNLIPSLVISDFIIGYANSTIVALTSSVDLNNTYIKINNKLWFNGQEG